MAIYGLQTGLLDIFGDIIDKEFDKVCYFGDLSNINYINYDISVDETE